jgi:nitrogen fixation protein NifZ
MTDQTSAAGEIDPEAAEGGDDKKPSAFSPPREPLYGWGERVSAAVDLLNDGSHPHAPEGALLVPKGTPGAVARVGSAPEINAPVYLVEFPGGVMVGCFEEELTPVGGPKRGVPGVLE